MIPERKKKGISDWNSLQLILSRTWRQQFPFSKWFSNSVNNLYWLLMKSILGVGGISMTTLFTFIEDCLTLIHWTHLHSVETKLRIFTFGTWFFHSRTTHCRVHVNCTVVFLGKDFGLNLVMLGKLGDCGSREKKRENVIWETSSFTGNRRECQYDQET